MGLPSPFGARGAPPHRAALRPAAALLAALLALAPSGHGREAAAQTVPPLGVRAGGVALPRVDAAAGRELALEGALDPAAYVVGPGDVFAVSIGGSVPRTATATVSADGTLVIPEAGSFRAAGRSLAAVAREAGAALQRRFRNVPTDVTLAEPRRFYVHVAGAVAAPGRHLVRAVGRLEDALAAASGGAPVRAQMRYAAARRGRPGAAATPDERAAAQARAAQDAATPLRPAFRNVAVEHADGGTTTVDVARYYATGDPRHNPYLRDGDRIRVPTFDPAQSGVFVGGAVLHPGVYDARPGDTALDLLAAAGADVEALDGVRVTGADGAEARLDVAEARRAAVGPRAQVFAVQGDPARGAATVEGAVRFPGTYPVTSGETTVAALVAMAGGLLADAQPAAAYLERTAALADIDTTGASGRVRTDGLDLGTAFYLQQQLLQTPRVSADIPGAVQGDAAVALVSGDRLVVPRDAAGVRVFGAVAEPGYLPFAAGRTAAEYVAAAGGPSTDATRTFVVGAATGRPAPDAGGAVGLGDAVFVAPETAPMTPQLAQLALQERQVELQAERDAREERRERRQARLQYFQIGAAVVSSVASALGFYVIARNN